MRCATDVIAAALCATPVLILAACAWWFFHERSPEPELSLRAAQHIEQQMRNVSPKILSSDIEEVFEYLKDHPVLLVKVSNGVCEVKAHHSNLKRITYGLSLEATFKKYIEHLKDGMCIWVIADDVSTVHLPEHLKHVPLFVFSINEATTYGFTPLLNVDAFTLKKWPRLYASIKRNIIPWKKQEKMLFWRGKSSDLLEQGTLASPRSYIVGLSYEHPDLINARFTKVFSKDSSTAPVLREKFKECSIVGEIDHLVYRYQVVIDGVTATFPGFLWRLASGCVVLKQNSTHKQWFYDWLVPYKHYLPLKSDLSDIMGVLQNSSEDFQSQLKQMVADSAKLVEEELTPAKVFGYFIGMVNALHKRVEMPSKAH